MDCDDDANKMVSVQKMQHFYIESSSLYPVTELSYSVAELEQHKNYAAPQHCTAWPWSARS
jgi:hypothetical protein